MSLALGLIDIWQQPEMAASELASCRRSVVVVGAGLAGLEIARWLDTFGASQVTVLEAGPADDLRHNHVSKPASQALRCWLDPTTDPCFRRPWHSGNPPHYAGASGLRQRVGGRSLYWYGVLLPIDDWALADERWPRDVVADLTTSWRDGPSLYSQVEADIDAWRLEHGGAGPARAKSLPEVHGHRLVPTPTAIVARSASHERWFAYSPLDYWRDPTSGAPRRQSSNVRIVPDVHVRGVTVGDHGVTGVTITPSGSAHQRSVSADTVVLAAGTIENSRLALQALTACGASVPRLTGLADHLVQGLFVRLEGAAAARFRAALPAGSYCAVCSESLRSILFLEVTEPAPDTVLVDLRLAGEQLSAATSYVEAVDTTAEPWVVRARATLAPEDRHLIAAQRAECQAVWDALAALAGQPTTKLRFAPFDVAARTNAVLISDVQKITAGEPLAWSSPLGTEDHEGGTIALGGMLTSDSEFAHVPGLFAVGPATFPRIGAANPGMTILALARRLAAHLATRDVLLHPTTRGHP